MVLNELLKNTIILGCGKGGCCCCFQHPRLTATIFGVTVIASVYQDS